eukprot:352001-Chlamydomonas_euryale.AAC.9
MGHVLRMDGDRLPWQILDCSVASFLGRTALQPGDDIREVPLPERLAMAPLSELSPVNWPH